MFVGALWFDINITYNYILRETETGSFKKPNRIIGQFKPPGCEKNQTQNC